MNLPNTITLIRLLLIPVFTALYFLDNILPYARFIATGLFLIAAITDFLDGYLARSRNEVTDLGKFLDPIADKMVVAAAFFLIIWSNDWQALQITVIVCAMIVTAREFIVSAFRMIAASKSLVLAADKLGKAKTVSQFIALPILMIAAPFSALISDGALKPVYITGLVLLIISTVLCVVSGLNYILSNKAVLKENA